MEAYNFSAGASITTVHAEREREGTSVASAKTIAKSVFSIATNITSGSEEEEEEQEGESKGMEGVEIDGMEVMDTEVQSLTHNMNRATAELNLESSESGQGEEQQEDHSSDSNDSSYSTEENPYDTPNEHDIDPNDYDEALEVSSGELEAVHANRFHCPVSFKQQLWNDAGPTVDSMVVQLSLIKDNLRDDEAGLQIEWMGVSKYLRAFLEVEAGQDPSEQRLYVEDMITEMYQLNPSEVRTFDPLIQEQEESPYASKTQGTPPGAPEARPAVEAAMPVEVTGGDKEGVRSLGMAPGG
jgi:hypothetical protein